MSRSSASESTARGMVEPTAALFALFAVCAAVTCYVSVLGDATARTDRGLADETATRVHDALSENGSVSPHRLPHAEGRGPSGHRLNVTVDAAGRSWARGPTPPATATDRAERRTSVRLGRGRVAAGLLRVVVWA